MGTLYLVATPIGNLEDLSARAVRVLSEVRLIAAEDTRQTGKLLTHFGILTPLTSYHQHSQERKIRQILESLSEGDVALVSDAVTPSLNDPGYELVRAALEAGYPVSPIPGPSAPIAALVVSGLPTDAFLYLGYLPRKQSERRRLLEKIAGLPYTLIFLETPHRLLVALVDLEAVLGDRQAAVAREMTKLFEEIYRGPLSTARAHFASQEPRGEFTLVIAGAAVQQETWSPERLRAALQESLAQGLSSSQIASQVAARSGWPRREV
ncbi:MAG TPA: 16S rRNA (cytidine(1402)-2'-O)-methyltransferase, partial [Anaerolineales bacterium]|nr:16S rRNA (cytidine(1402)-2'-O)-methyltransferase [Anaerolineales bacterium]